MNGLLSLLSRDIFILILFIWINEPLLAQKFDYAQATVITQTGVSIPVEIADTVAKRSLGLGKRESLRKGWGMLFVFEKRIHHTFWMKEMRFPIDIIWLDNYRIVEIARQVQPPKENTLPKRLKPASPSNFVLEIEAGRAEELGLGEGRQLRYQF